MFWGKPMGTMARWVIWFCWCGLPAILLGCGPTVPVERTEFQSKTKIVATFSVLGDWVANIAGPGVEITTLVGPDGDAHTFEPTPREALALAQADLVFEIGIGFEPWLDKLYQASGSKAKRVVVSQGIRLRNLDSGPTHPTSKGPDKPGAEWDPHIWHDVKIALTVVGTIRDHLMEKDAFHASVYQKNYDLYYQKLNELHDWVVNEVSKLPLKARKLVTNHDTFGYFAERYGFSVIGTALSSISTEAADPSAAEFASLSDKIRSAGVPAIFTENIHNPKLMERLAKETGTRLAPGLFTDALGPRGSSGATYEAMIRHNVATMVFALRP